tara:strand:- start:90 stop:923 length:834 start_codon:yes stop_codon:yes gene_type:complete
MWAKCPWQWKLNYVDKLREFHGNIHTIFGTAMHEVIQTYLTTMYTKTIKEADSIPLDELLQERLKVNFAQVRESSEIEPCTKEELTEFYYDGLKIIDFLKKNRGAYFSKKGYELLGIEVELDFDLPNNLRYTGFLDIVLRDNYDNRIKIIDIKTSTNGWNKWVKKDKLKSDQLLLYKQFYSKQYNLPMDRIDVEFFIVKRKLYENCDWPQKRVQLFTPASGTVSINKVLKTLKEFIQDGFTDTGEHRTDHIFEKKPSDKNCKWCEFKDKPELCDRNA